MDNSHLEVIKREKKFQRKASMSKERRLSSRLHVNATVAVDDCAKLLRSVLNRRGYENFGIYWLEEFQWTHGLKEYFYSRVYLRLSYVSG